MASSPALPVASGARIERERFSPEQCDALFGAVLVNDRVDADVRLPGRIHLDYRQEQLVRCFLICRQVWREGVDRSAFVSLLVKLRTSGALGCEDQLLFKNVRAKFKQLRFAYANMDDRHRYPRALHHATTMMGRLQDDFKNDRGGAIRRRALLLLLRFWLARPLYAVITREVDRFRPTTVAGLRACIADQLAFVRSCVGNGRITGKDFHEIRKIISRQTSLYVALVTLYPSPYHDSVFRCLSSLNGLMGALHDDLIQRKMLGTQDYHHDAFVLPTEINERLIALIAAYGT